MEQRLGGGGGTQIEDEKNEEEDDEWEHVKEEESGLEEAKHGSMEEQATEGMSAHNEASCSSDSFSSLVIVEHSLYLRTGTFNSSESKPPAQEDCSSDGRPG